MLYAVGCLRLAGPLPAGLAGSGLLEAAEELADGQLTQNEFTQSYRAGGFSTVTPSIHLTRAAEALIAAATARHLYGYPTACADAAGSVPEHLRAAEFDPPNATLLECVFGRLVKKPMPFPFIWWSSAATGLARSMYESRDFAAMPVLADALQEAGCEDTDVLAHCRGDVPHVRGCWVVDGVLGK